MTSSPLLRNLLSEAIKTLNQTWVKKLVRYAIGFVILTFIAFAIIKNWQQITNYDWHINYLLLFLSVLLIIVTTIVGATIWALILTGFSQKLSLAQLIAIWLQSQVAKYVPGGFWNLVGRAYLCKQQGHSITHIILSLFLETALYLLAQFIVILLLGSFAFDFLNNVQYPIILGIIVLASLLVLHPKALTISLHILARFYPKKIELPDITPLNLARLLILYISFTILGGVTFYVFIISIYQLPLSRLPAIIVIVTISFVISFLSPLAPNGLGVREGVFALLLAQFIPAPVAIVIALAARLWLIVGEVLSAGLGLFLMRILK